MQEWPGNAGPSADRSGGGTGSGSPVIADSANRWLTPTNNHTSPQVQTTHRSKNKNHTRDSAKLPPNSPPNQDFERNDTTVILGGIQIGAQSPPKVRKYGPKTRSGVRLIEGGYTMFTWWRKKIHKQACGSFGW